MGPPMPPAHGLVRADVRRHLVACRTTYRSTWTARRPRPGDEERREDINSAEVRIAPQQKDAAVHRRKYHAADDSGAERGKRKRLLSAEAMHGGEKQQHQKRADAVPSRSGSRRKTSTRCNTDSTSYAAATATVSMIYARRHILPRRVQQPHRPRCAAMAHTSSMVAHAGHASNTSSSKGNPIATTSHLCFIVFPLSGCFSLTASRRRSAAPGADRR